MNIRLLRKPLVIAGICLLVSCAVTAQTRRPAAQRDRTRALQALPGLSPAERSSIARVQTVNIPWFDSLETGGTGWTTDGFWHITTQPQHIEVLNPDINPNLVLLADSGALPAAHSGNNVFWYGQDVTGSYIGSDFTSVSQSPRNGGNSTGEGNGGSVITPPINLVGQKTPLLSFWTWWEIEGIDVLSHDVMYVEVSSDSGANWGPLGRGFINPIDDQTNASDYWKAYSSGGLGQVGKWIREYFDVTPYVGKIILIRFRFNTIDNLYNGFRGWLIDDISVGTSGAGTPTITQVSPAVVNTSRLLSITGTNFVSGAQIRVDTTLVDPFFCGVVSTDLAHLTVPSTLSGGLHSIRITNPDGKTAILTTAFTVTTNAPPGLDQSPVTPDSVPVGVATPITITGSNFSTIPTAGPVVVTIGGLACSQVTVASASIIHALSPSKLAAGVYNLTVTNPDGLSAISILGFRVVIPSVYVAATGDSLVGNAQPLTITPPVGSAFNAGKIFYRKGGVPGAASFDSTALIFASGSFSVDLPASVVTIRGVEYYVRLQNLQGVSLTYPTTTPALNPAVLPVRLAKLAAPLGLSPLKYKMVSAPMILDAPDVLNQLGDDFGAYNPAVWRVFHWESGAYREAVVSASVARPMALTPGKAYWLVTTGGNPVTFKRGTSVPTVQPYTIPVDTGWNQIANPFPFNVDWFLVTGASQLSGPYYYDGTQYRLIQTVLKPYEGYFVYNPPFSETTSLTFLPSESPNPPLYKGGAESAPPGPGEFVMQIAASMPGTDLQDTYNFIGFRNGASAGKDNLDAPKPPAIGDALQVEIVEAGTAYLQNFKPAAGEGQSWVFDLRSSGTKGSALMTLAPSGTLPAGYSVHVLDLNQENALPSSSGSFTVALDAPNARRYFKVIIGTDAYAAKEAAGIPLQPVAYALEQNYPNPFNPSTTIRYAIAKKTDVVLEIYNTIGQRVRTLFNGEQTTGEYESVWDGTNDVGRHVASGVYFYRLRTGDYNAVRKLVMIR